jgi:AraC family transcriptional regulator
MTATHTPADRVAYLHQHLLGRHLRGAAPDALLVEETTMRLVRSVVRHLPQPASARRAGTSSSHVALTESAKELLAASLAEPLGLHEVAARLGVSPFHLARVFRSRTGFALHQYRTQLRLRVALERLPESEGALTSLAFELGFASHSHFTDTFRREFGVAPSAVRDDRQVRRLLAA